MRTLLPIAAAFALLSTATAHAQIVNPDKMVSPPPHNPAVRRGTLQPAYDWLWQYTQPAPGGDKKALLADARFRDLLRDNFKGPQAMWSWGSPLADAAQTFLAGEGTVASSDNRHLTITGCVVEHCKQRGLLYVDLGERDPLMVFLALRWNEQSRTTDEPRAPFTLWIFTTRILNPHQLPQTVKDTSISFTGSGRCNGTNVTSVLLIDPNGVPHVVTPLEAGLRAPLCITNPLPL